MTPLTRRSFLALSAALPLAARAEYSPFSPSSKIPVGLELYSVRDRLKEDPFGTVRAVGQMGYAGVEFYAPYYEWNHDQAKQMRKLLDDLGMRCFSTHNDEKYFDPDKLEHARDLNLILGSKTIVLAWSDTKTADDAKALADKLNRAAEHLAPDGLGVG